MKHDDPLYLVLGPPNSGTHWMKDILLTGCGVRSTCRHADSVNERLIGAAFCVVMTRGIARWVDSVTASERFEKGITRPEGKSGRYSQRWWVGEPKTDQECHQFSYAEIFRQLAEHGTPFAVVSYESLVTDPDDTVATLCDWMGTEFSGWTEKTEPVDGNEKWRTPCAASF